MRRDSQFSIVRRQGLPLVVLLALLCCSVLVGCQGLAANADYIGAPQQHAAAAPAQNLKLFVLPGAGEKVVLDAIKTARTSIWIEVYLMTNRQVIDALKSAAKAGKDVRVLLESRPFGGGGLSPKEVMQLLKDGGVKVKESNTKYRFTHEKAMVVDGKTAYILTFNMSAAAMTGKNREYGITDTNSADVKTIKDIFQADWDRKSPTISNANLVVSPVNSRDRITNLIKSATKSLLIQMEVMNDDKVEKAIADVARKGVDVEVVVPEEGGTLGKNNADAAKILKAGGVKMRIISSPYMHAKMILADGKKAYIGSVNISTTSFDQNRELGILLSDAAMMKTLASTFATDWKKAKAV